VWDFSKVKPLDFGLALINLPLHAPAKQEWFGEARKP
jgi:hypothetical protein